MSRVESVRRARPSALASHVLSPEARLQIFAERREEMRRTKLDDLVAEISRSLLNATDEQLDAPLLRSLASLGQALGADRVLFYVGQDVVGQDARKVLASTGNPSCSDETGFEPYRLWTSDGGIESSIGNATTIDLDYFEDRGRSLAAGYARHFPAADGAANDSIRSGWNSTRTFLYVPCAIEGRLFGFFEIEASLVVARLSDPLVDRAELVGRLFAGAFERLRLTRKIKEGASRQGHDARLETLGRVASAVAHDFNNVLTAILGYTDLLEFELEDGGGQSELAEIRTAATRAAGLVDQVLNFGRTQRTGVEAIDLAQTIEGFGGMLRQVVGSKIDVRCDWGSAEEAIPVRLDPGRLGPVIMNLASNARGANANQPSPGVFTLSTRRVVISHADCDPETDAAATIGELRRGTYMRLSAADNGCGVDPLLIERIFEPFFTTKPPSVGTGLGLASMAEFVEQAGGAIRVESTPGQGSVFHLYFPAAA